MRTHAIVTGLILAAATGCGRAASSASVNVSSRSSAPPSAPAAAPSEGPMLAGDSPATAVASGWPPRTDFATPPSGALKTPSGLSTQTIRKGTGTAPPAPHDRVIVHYTGWTADGKKFDSSVDRGAPATFGVNQIIKGFSEALQLMVAGERRRVWIPTALAYGETPSAGAPAGPLTFDIELVDVIVMPAPPTAPEDVKEPPGTAKRTKSGLAYRVLNEGTGARPRPTDSVVVQYSGWTTDGKLFDSSVTRGEPAEFPLNKVIPGWTEGVQLMKVGEKTRFWIPGKLAYGDTPSRAGVPAGMLVFDIELIGIQTPAK